MMLLTYIIFMEVFEMVSRELLSKKIEKMPSKLLEEVANYISYIEYRETKGEVTIQDITLASEKSLAKEWLSSEEERAWEHL